MNVTTVIRYSAPATGWMVQGSNPSTGNEFFSSPTTSRSALRGPPTLLLNWYRGSFSRVKWPMPKVDHSPPSSAKIKNAWSYTSIPPYMPFGVNRDFYNFLTLQVSKPSPVVISFLLTQTRVHRMILGPVSKNISFTAPDDGKKSTFRKNVLREQHDMQHLI
jgi:hypothetical protein